MRLFYNTFLASHTPRDQLYGRTTALVFGKVIDEARHERLGGK